LNRTTTIAVVLTVVVMAGIVAVGSVGARDASHPIAVTRVTTSVSLAILGEPLDPLPGNVTPSRPISEVLDGLDKFSDGAIRFDRSRVRVWLGIYRQRPSDVITGPAICVHPGGGATATTAPPSPSRVNLSS